MTETMTNADRARLERLIEGFHPQQFALTAGEARGLFARVSTLEAENAKLRALLAEVDGCAVYCATVTGPQFHGWNRSALDRLHPKVRALVQGGPDAAP